MDFIENIVDEYKERIKYIKLEFVDKFVKKLQENGYTVLEYYIDPYSVPFQTHEAFLLYKNGGFVPIHFSISGDCIMVDDDYYYKISELNSAIIHDISSFDNHNTIYFFCYELAHEIKKYRNMSIEDIILNVPSRIFIESGWKTYKNMLFCNLRRKHKINNILRENDSLIQHIQC